MNLLYKLLPDFLKKRFYPEIYFEPDEDIIFDARFWLKPCKGSLEIGDHCKGCRFEKEHT